MNPVSRKVESNENKKCTMTFTKRRNGLINKARELSVLCGVDACMIIIAPKENQNNDEPVDPVWSSSSDSGATVEKLIKKYKEDKRKKVYNVSSYFVDKTRKAEKELASLKKKNSEARKLSTWNSKFESMKEHELRGLANDLEIKIEDLKSRRKLMKNKRINVGIDSSHIPSLHADQQLWSNGENNFQPMFMMEPNYIYPTTMNSVHCNSNYDSQAVVRNQMMMTTNLIVDVNNYYVQPTDKIKPDVVNPMVTPTFDHYTSVNPMVRPMFDHYPSTDLQPQCGYYTKQFVNNNSGAQTEAKAYAYRNPQIENCVPMQSFYYPPLPPSMLDQSTNGNVSSWNAEF